ncbi:MAG: hypothetical protein ACRYFZ_27240 [Janthinobacterium lividum]
MKKILCLLPSLLIMAALSGCCANNVCNCNDALADALSFRVNYTRHRQYNGTAAITFSASDVDTLRIYRTTRPPANAKDTLSFVRSTDSVTVARVARPSSTSPADTVIYTPTTTSAGTTLVEQDVVVINNTSPFASTSTTKLSGYTYRIGVISNASRRRKPLAIYYITNVQLQGRFNGNGCCTCYENTGKTYTLTARSIAPTAVDAADSGSVRRVVRLPFVPR